MCWFVEYLLLIRISRVLISASSQMTYLPVIYTIRTDKNTIFYDTPTGGRFCRMAFRTHNEANLILISRSLNN